MPIKKDLSIDIDGVLCDCVPKVMEKVNEKHGTLYCRLDVKKFNQTITVPRFKFFGTVIGTKELNLGPLFRKYTAERNFIMSLEPLKECRDYLWFLSDLWNLHINSARSSKSLPFLKEWLKIHDFPEFKTITLDSDKKCGDVLIDDFDGNLLRFSGDKILFKHPWSVNFPETLDMIDEGEIIVCENWQEVYKKLSELHNFWVV